MGTRTPERIWEKHCNRAFHKAGIVPIPSWPSCVVHTKLMLSIEVSVDDFKLAGPRGNLSPGWSLLRHSLQLEDLAPVHLYLGRVHEAREATAGNKATACTLVCNMEGYLRNTVASYCELVSGITGQAPRA